MNNQTALCKLAKPATCEYRIDGRLSHTILCGGNGLCDDVKKCPCRALAEIKELAATDSQQRHAARAKATLPPDNAVCEHCLRSTEDECFGCQHGSKFLAATSA